MMKEYSNLLDAGITGVLSDGHGRILYVEDWNMKSFLSDTGRKRLNWSGTVTVVRGPKQLLSKTKKYKLRLLQHGEDGEPEFTWYGDVTVRRVAQETFAFSGDKHGRYRMV